MGGVRTVQGRILRSFSHALLTVLACIGPTSASAQQIDTWLLPPDPAYASQTPFRPAATSQWNAGQPANDLALRVADLEAALKEMQNKEAAAKKEAAGRPSVRVGGRIQADWGLFSQNDASKLQAGDFQNGMEFRRARLAAWGDAFDVVDYKIQIDFAPATTVRNADSTGAASIGQFAFKDVYITLNELPVLGRVRAGYFKMPFGLEQLTSTRYTTFMERALISDGPEAEGRRTGIMAFDHNDAQNFTWAIGSFVSQIPENPPIFRNDSGGTALVTRYTFLPWYDEASGGRGLLHTGIAYGYLDIAGGNAVVFRQRPEAHLAERVVNTGRLSDVSDLQTLGAETALVYGPLSVQAEYNNIWVDRTDNADARLHGAYAYVSYFLTGEHRVYERSAGRFVRVKPFENFFRVRDVDGYVQMGKGAWEVAYRFSYLDLNDAEVHGGYVRDHTVGLNWYLNPYTRLILNYVNSQTTNHPKAPGVGEAHIFETRFQIDF